MSYWNRQFKKHNNKYGFYCSGKGNDLSRQVLMALTAAGFFMTPFSAYASAITPANTTHSSTVRPTAQWGVTGLLISDWIRETLPTCALTS